MNIISLLKKVDEFPETVPQRLEKLFDPDGNTPTWVYLIRFGLFVCGVLVIVFTALLGAQAIF